MLLKVTLLLISCSLMISLNNAACPTIISRAVCKFSFIYLNHFLKGINWSWLKINNKFEKEWGARAPSSSISKMASPVTYAVVHHSAGAHCTTKAGCISQVKGFQNYHMDSNGWSDIGYNFIVGEDGNVYEGRGWTTMGAHRSVKIYDDVLP